MADIATIKQNDRSPKPFSVELLKSNSRYAESAGRFETLQQAMDKIKALGATPVSEYRFSKELSAS